MRVHGVCTVIQPPETKETKGGLSMLKIRLMDKNSRKRNQFWDGVVWGEKRVADYMEAGLAKGSQVFVDGEIKQDEWGDEGSKKISYEINLQEMIILGGSATTPKAETAPPQASPVANETPSVEEPPF